MAALGLLVLAAALLAGSVVASVGSRRAARSFVAAARAESEGRHALGAVMAGWGGAADSLHVGGVLEPSLPASVAAGPPVVVHARVQRLTRTVFAVNVSVDVGAGTSAPAYRRVRLLLERMSQGDSTPVVGPPSPIARWSVIDLR